ncbi:phosphoribosylglycinamide formyltransferase [Magnetovibrio blakemorei]|uniref:Phosphoribosylglycinamide formyltransferase n=1 Tax=Magnetovibrio blakemorei TaxID=28181 RepID=A0A1E5Q5P0_9PROT|nr:phosphoribosylglycinamide formyltransferase [Magnetovibrio blakemorei]OEJ65583.1 phosphoribosylglycinamide formyltransferase [Magnetovibrio blakemorei]
MKLAVLVSGRGSNLQALIDACKSEDYPAEIVLVLSNKADAYGLVRAQEAGIPTTVLSPKDFADRESFDAAMSDKIAETGAELVCLAGFMRLLSDGFVRTWRDRLINIHPSLLPSYKGLHVHERAIEDGARFSGCTVHFVRPAMDEGPIIAQAVVAVHPEDTADALAARILEQEHILYPRAVKLIAEGRIRVSAERVLIKDHTPPQGTLSNPSA